MITLARRSLLATPKIALSILFVACVVMILGAASPNKSVAATSLVSANSQSEEQQEEEVISPGQEASAANQRAKEEGAASDLKKKADDVADDVQKTVDDVAKRVDEDETAQEFSAGILQPIYQLAEFFSFPAFHWLAFALMVAGTVSFAGQLVLGKLVMLAHLKFSLMEVIADGLGLVVCLIGLVLTTQAATENSTFTQSPFAVLSATLVGAIVGLVLYLQGQSQELRAAKQQSREHKKS